MRKLKFKIITVLLIQIFFVVCVSQQSNAQNFPPDDWQGGAEGGWYVNVDAEDPLNVRSLPSHKAAKVGIVTRGVEVNILDTAENGWRFVETNKLSGWVNGIYLSDKPLEQNNILEEGLIPLQRTANDALISTAQPNSVIIENSPVKTSENFEAEFTKYKRLFRDNDKCFRSLKYRSELVGLTMQLEQNDPIAFRNLKSKYDECLGVLDINSLEILENKVEVLAVNDELKIRVHNFRREYTEIIENAAGLLQMSQLMGISLE